MARKSGKKRNSIIGVITGLWSTLMIVLGATVTVLCLIVLLFPRTKLPG